MVRVGHKLRKHYKKTTTNVISFVLPYKDKVERKITRTWEINLYGEVSEIVLKPTPKLVIKKEVV